MVVCAICKKNIFKDVEKFSTNLSKTLDLAIMHAKLGIYP